jgi:hypothetical protein
MATSEKKRRIALSASIMVGCITLIILHGIEDNLCYPFKVDEVTLALLVLGMLPVLPKFLTSFKGFGLDLALKDSGRVGKIYDFLGKLASVRQWTFYPPRGGESSFGQGFMVIVEDLIRDKDELVKHLKDWWKGDDNMKWFVAEIVGHYKIAEMREAMQVAIKDLKIEDEWRNWQLNSLWALSRFENYHSLAEQLKNPGIHPENRTWIIDSLLQMERLEADSANSVAKDNIKSGLARYPDETRMRKDLLYDDNK